MSWDATLAYRGATTTAVACDQNYTHNTNEMISAALEVSTGKPAPPCGGSLGFAIGPAWWEVLDGATGADGADYLDSIISGLRSDPARFRAMNPENEWGSYDSLLAVLEAMATASREHPTAAWDASG